MHDEKEGHTLEHPKLSVLHFVPFDFGRGLTLFGTVFHDRLIFHLGTKFSKRGNETMFNVSNYYLRFKHNSFRKWTIHGLHSARIYPFNLFNQCFLSFFFLTLLSLSKFFMDKVGASIFFFFLVLFKKRKKKYTEPPHLWHCCYSTLNFKTV
jgi:hypothetical protein